MKHHCWGLTRTDLLVLLVDDTNWQEEDVGNVEDVENHANAGLQNVLQEKYLFSSETKNTNLRVVKKRCLCVY